MNSLGHLSIKVRITCLTEVHIYPLINAQDSPTYIRAAHLPSEWWWICLCMCLYIAVVCMGRMWYRYGLCEAHAQVSFKRQVSTLLLIVSFLLLLPSFTPICRGRLRTDRSSWICLTQYMYITLIINVHHFPAHMQQKKKWNSELLHFLGICCVLPY